MRVARRSASLLSSHGMRLGPQDALKKDSRGLSRVAASEGDQPWDFFGRNDATPDGGLTLFSRVLGVGFQSRAQSTAWSSLLRGVPVLHSDQAQDHHQEAGLGQPLPITQHLTEGEAQGGDQDIGVLIAFHLLHLQAKDQLQISGVSSSCGARGGFLPRHDEDLREPLAPVC